MFCHFNSMLLCTSWISGLEVHKQGTMAKQNKNLKMFATNYWGECDLDMGMQVF